MKNKSTVSKILSKIKPYTGYLILALISAIISVSLTLYIPVLVGQAIDNIVNKGNVNFQSGYCPHLVDDPYLDKPGLVI